MNKQFSTKISILIDKLSYISNNDNFVNLTENDIDFKLIKNYAKELYELFNAAHGPVIENQAPKPNIITKTVEIEQPIRSIEKPQPFEQKIEEEKKEITNEINTGQPGEEFMVKPVTDNIFDTVKSIKQKSKVSRLSRLQLNENDKKEETIINNEVFETEISEEIDLKQVPNHNQVPTPNSETDKQAEITPSFIKEEATVKETATDAENLSLNDRFKHNTESVADKVVNTSFKNLKELIDINDRFLFIQKLFGGSYLAFEESVNEINKIETYSEALDYIDYKIKSHFDWDSNAEEVNRFLIILEKKYN